MNSRSVLAVIIAGSLVLAFWGCGPRAARRMYQAVAALDSAGHLDDALAAYDRVIERLGESGEPRVQRLAAASLMQEGTLFSRQGRKFEAERMCHELLRRFRRTESPRIKKRVVRALAEKAALQENDPRLCDQALSVLGAAPNGQLRSMFLEILVHKTVAPSQCGRKGEALRVRESTVAENEGSPNTEVRYHTAQAMLVGGTIGRRETARRDATDAGRRDCLHRKWVETATTSQEQMLL